MNRLTRIRPSTTTKSTVSSIGRKFATTLGTTLKKMMLKATAAISAIAISLRLSSGSPSASPSPSPS